MEAELQNSLLIPFYQHLSSNFSVAFIPLSSVSFI
jgi:hypothetical protein